MLLADPAGPQQHLLIVVDQFEELLTQTAPTDRARFTELLRPALTGPVRVVATLRPEFLDQLLVDPELATLPTRTSTLRPLRREALRAVIEKPARLAGINLDEGLADRLVDDTDTGEALPLLAFTLAQLAEGVGRGGRLSRARYDQLGGVQGALTHQADAALTDAVAAGGRSREQVIAGLLRLVTVDEQGHPTRWRILRDELPSVVITELDAFVARRLLTIDTDNGAVVIGVAHEAFLSAWPPLAQAITANVTALRARRTIEHAATEWDGDSRPRERLWGGGHLAGVLAGVGVRISTSRAPPSGLARWWPRRPRVLVTDRVDLSPTARDFLHASIRHDRFRRRRGVSVLSVLLILALIAAGVAVDQQRRAQERQQIATARQLVAQAGTLLGSDPRTALRFGIAAERIHPGGETRGGLFNLLSSTPYAGALAAHPDWVNAVAFSPDGRTLATASRDRTVILWDRTNPAAPRPLSQPLTAHTGSVSSVAFSPDGRTLATASDDRTVILWDLTNPTAPRPLSQPLTAHTGLVRSVAFSPDGRTLATASDDRTVILWDLTNPATPRPLGQPLTAHTSWVFSVAFAPDGHTLATTSADGTAVLWDLTAPAAPRQPGRTFTAHTESVLSVAFAPDGHTLATASTDGTVILWDLAGRAAPRQLGQPLTRHTESVSSVAFAPDGRILATAGHDGTLILWDLTDPARPHQLGQPLTAHTSSGGSVVFAPDGDTLATTGLSGSYDGRSILWDLTDPVRPHQLGQPLNTPSIWVFSVAFAPDGRTLATAGGRAMSSASNDAVILWDITDPTRPHQLGQPLTAHTGPASVIFAPDGRTLVTASDRTVILWDLADLTRPHQLGQPLIAHTGPVRSVAFSPDGRILATASADKTILLWNLTDPARPHQLGRPFTAHTASVRSVAFSPDGRTLATASDDRTAILWDLTDPTAPHLLGQPVTAHTGSVSVAFAPDGRTLATASDDRTVILWDLTDLNQVRDHAVERACSIAGGGLDRDEWKRYIPDLTYQSSCPV